MQDIVYIVSSSFRLIRSFIQLLHFFRGSITIIRFFPLKMATWSKDSVIDFIEKYRSCACLWKVKSKDYSNRIKREQAYQELVDYVKVFEPEADKDFVIKKINNLRNAYRKQLRKVETSKLSGAGRDEIYEPKLWYFSALEFLRDQEITRPSQSNLNPDNVEETFTPLEVEIDLPDDSPTDALTPISSENPSTSTPPLPAHNAGQGADNRSGRSSSSSCSSRPAKRKASAESELLVLARNRLLNPPNVREEDQYDTFSKTIGHKLRNLPTTQSIHAQKLISDIIYEAELGTLSRHTAIVNRNLAYEQSQQQHPVMENDVYRSYDYI